MRLLHGLLMLVFVTFVGCLTIFAFTGVQSRADDAYTVTYEPPADPQVVEFVPWSCVEPCTPPLDVTWQMSSPAIANTCTGTCAAPVTTAPGKPRAFCLQSFDADGAGGPCSNVVSLAQATTTQPTVTTTTLPATGTCANPIAIAPGVAVVHGITAGTSAVVAGCAAETANAPDKIYRWVAPATGTATFSTCGTETAFDTVLSVRDTNCAGAILGCNDDTTGCGSGDTCINANHHGSSVTLQVVAGKAYAILVDGFGGSCGGAAGNFVLNISAPVGTSTSSSATTTTRPATTSTSITTTTTTTRPTTPPMGWARCARGDNQEHVCMSGIDQNGRCVCP